MPIQPNMLNNSFVYLILKKENTKSGTILKKHAKIKFHHINGSSYHANTKN